MTQNLSKTARTHTEMVQSCHLQIDHLFSQHKTLLTKANLRRPGQMANKFKSIITTKEIGFHKADTIRIAQDNRQ